MQYQPDIYIPGPDGKPLEGEELQRHVMRKRMSALHDLVADIGAAEQIDKGGAEIIEEMRR